MAVEHHPVSLKRIDRQQAFRFLNTSVIGLLQMSVDKSADSDHLSLSLDSDAGLTPKRTIARFIIAKSFRANEDEARGMKIKLLRMQRACKPWRVF